jgi:hypothetical protein
MPNFVYIPEFEILTAAAMNRANFWYVTLCSPAGVFRRFGETVVLNLDLILAKKETTIPEFSSCSVKGRTLF